MAIEPASSPTELKFAILLGKNERSALAFMPTLSLSQAAEKCSAELLASSEKLSPIAWAFKPELKFVLPLVWMLKLLRYLANSQVRGYEVLLLVKVADPGLRGLLDDDRNSIGVLPADLLALGPALLVGVLLLEKIRTDSSDFRYDEVRFVTLTASKWGVLGDIRLQRQLL